MKMFLDSKLTIINESKAAFFEGPSLVSQSRVLLPNILCYIISFEHKSQGVWAEYTALNVRSAFFLHTSKPFKLLGLWWRWRQ